MKYFKVTNINDPESDGKYDIVEVSKDEFDLNTEDGDPPTFFMGRDLDVDEDYEDDDEFWD